MRNLPIVTRSILWANIIVFLLDMVLRRTGIQLADLCGLHYFTAQQFYVWQPLTYMFLHADLGHIFCNMFAVLMFAPVLEREWGWKRFLTYYLVCGVDVPADARRDVSGAGGVLYQSVGYHWRIGCRLRYPVCFRLVVSQCAVVYHVRAYPHTRACVRNYLRGYRTLCRLG